MFVSLLPSLIFSLSYFVDLVVVATHMTLTTLGLLIFRHKNGPSYNAPGLFPAPVQVMLLSSSVMLYMSLVGV